MSEPMTAGMPEWPVCLTCGARPETPAARDETQFVCPRGHETTEADFTLVYTAALKEANRLRGVDHGANVQQFATRAAVVSGAIDALLKAHQLDLQPDGEGNIYLVAQADGRWYEKLLPLQRVYITARDLPHKTGMRYES